jgi:asparagine synthase (glutamine-hydrolysing)
MCGIVGVLGELGRVVDKFVSKKILDSLACRGPDNQTLWISDSYSLGHTRLSIIGLDATSNQPFSIPGSEWIMTFNGEVYNYKELRETLIAKGYEFETNSDTEVLFKGFLEFGTNFFSSIRGMFAVAFFNPKTGRLVLARDFSGEKPLYFLLAKNSVIFSSCVASFPLSLFEFEFCIQWNVH